MDTTTVRGKKYSQEEFLELVLLASLEGGFQIAIFKNPNEKQVNILIDTTENVKRVPIQLEDLPSGFVIHPFADQADKKGYFLEASVLFKFNLEEESVFPHELPAWVAMHQNSLSVKSRIKKKLADVQIPLVQKFMEPSSKLEFMEMVRKGIDEILSGQLSKIVPVRRKKVP